MGSYRYIYFEDVGGYCHAELVLLPNRVFVHLGVVLLH